MFRRAFTFTGMLLLAGALVLGSARQAQAQRGGHAGGAHFGSAHFGGYHGGFSRGGLSGGYHGYGNRPSYGYHHYGYRPYYGHRSYPYSGYYPYSYGYNPGSYGYNPGSYGYNPDYDGYYGNYDSDMADVGLGMNADVAALGSFADDDPLPGAGIQASSSAAQSTSSLAAPAAVPEEASAQADASAHVTVRVPAGAEVWFEGHKTTSTGLVREFQSPPLTPNQQFAYDIRARWAQNGRVVTQTQQIDVSAGAHANVAFPVQTGKK